MYENSKNFIPLSLIFDVSIRWNDEYNMFYRFEKSKLAVHHTITKKKLRIQNCCLTGWPLGGGKEVGSHLPSLPTWGKGRDFFRFPFPHGGREDTLFPPPTWGIPHLFSHLPTSFWIWIKFELNFELKLKFDRLITHTYYTIAPHSSAHHLSAHYSSTHHSWSLFELSRNSWNGMWEMWKELKREDFSSFPFLPTCGKQRARFFPSPMWEGKRFSSHFPSQRPTCWLKNSNNNKRFILFNYWNSLKKSRVIYHKQKRSRFTEFKAYTIICLII